MPSSSSPCICNACATTHVFCFISSEWMNRASTICLIKPYCSSFMAMFLFFWKVKKSGTYGRFKSLFFTIEVNRQKRRSESNVRHKISLCLFSSLSLQQWNITMFVLSLFPFWEMNDAILIDWKIKISNL